MLLPYLFLCGRKSFKVFGPYACLFAPILRKSLRGMHMALFTFSLPLLWCGGKRGGISRAD